jgi:hypothetical protein
VSSENDAVIGVGSAPPHETDCSKEDLSATNRLNHFLRR